MSSVWTCSRCKLTCPSWDGAEGFNLCTACERQLKEARGSEIARLTRKVEVVEFAPVEAFHATARALLCLFPHTLEIWVPRSQVGEGSEVLEAGDAGVLVTTRWWAERAEVDYLSN